MSAIPRSLTRAHVEAALDRIDRDGVPPRREATKFHLVARGRRYPPKYVLSLAVAEATGRELRADEFYGGTETNGVLRGLGFTIAAPPGTPSREADAGTEGDLFPVVRVVVRGRTAFSPGTGAEVLLEAFKNWPVPQKAKFTITPGGFVAGWFPKRWDGGVGWESSGRDLAALVDAAQPVVARTITKKVLAAAKTRTRMITVGVDLCSDDGQPLHAELVAVIDCDSGKIVRWTGKSYPTSDQEMHLVQVSDLSTHLLEVAGERVLVLGCHDLNMFSGRGRANQNPDGVRRRRCEEMMKATARFGPSIVLQHPHSTDSANIWRMPWACLTRDYPSVQTYASGVGYSSWEGKPRRPLDGVLQGTRSQQGVVDVVVKSR